MAADKSGAPEKQSDTSNKNRLCLSVTACVRAFHQRHQTLSNLSIKSIVFRLFLHCKMLCFASQQNNSALIRGSVYRLWLFSAAYIDLKKNDSRSLQSDPFKWKECRNSTIMFPAGCCAVLVCTTNNEIFCVWCLQQFLNALVFFFLRIQYRWLGLTCVLFSRVEEKLKAQDAIARLIASPIFSKGVKLIPLLLTAHELAEYKHDLLITNSA